MFLKQHWVEICIFVIWQRKCNTTVVNMDNQKSSTTQDIAAS